MKCEKCGSELDVFDMWEIHRVARPWVRPTRFCSLDCLSRWVEAQRLIAVVEERP